jgi:hypothetical protein
VQPGAVGGFLLNVGGAECRCGTNQTLGALFRYDSFPVTLEAGPVPVTVRFEGPAGLDCIMLSADPRYRPDIADVNGPVWMRFRANNPRIPPYHIHLYCVTIPMSQRGPLGQSAAVLFRDRLALSGYDYAAALRAPDNLLRPGEWSPWARTLHSNRPTWWSEVILLGRGTSQQTRFLVPDIPPARGGLSGTTLDCAFATRPDARRAFRVETGLALDSGSLQVSMPTRLTLPCVRRDALTFDAWARRRFEEFVAPLGLQPSPPPREFLLYTTVDASSRAQTDYAVKTLGLLGFNAVGVPMHRDAASYWRMAESNGVAFTGMGHWIPGLGLTAFYVLRPLRRELAPGEDAVRAVLDSFAESARNFYTPDSDSQRGDLARVRFFPMGDEIGPFTDGVFIKRLPLVRGWFHAFLKEHGQTPESFGKTNWSEVDAAGNITNIPPGSDLDKILAGIDPALRAITSNELAQAEAAKEEAIGAVLGTREIRDVLADEDVADPAADAVLAPATPEEKRLHYWTQRFRSLYTARFYAVCDQALVDLEAQVVFRHPPMASPNFQAAPMHHGHFWDGALNLFEWGRLNGTRFMLMEDWTLDPYKVAWGRTLLRGAARKNGQKLVSLLVGSGVTQRFLVDLGNGVKGVEAYRYGPIARIGPVWADNPKTLREWAELSRMTARWETDILAATNRPAQAAILVDNTAEINARYLQTSFRRGEPLFDRVAMFVALADAGIPVEVIGAEEVIEDDILARFKALYVCDPHLDRRTQERIRDWVRAGGVLWASYAAGARDEYDEPSVILDPVFGLAARPVLTNAPSKWEAAEEPEIRIESGSGLSAAVFKSVPLNPGWTLVEGVETLARLGDGAPAFIRNRFGKGQAFLLGSVAWRLIGATSSRVAEPPEAAALREVVAVAARAAGVELHLRKSHPRVLAFVHDGPGQTLVYLANCFEKALPDFRVEVRLPSRPVSAFFGRGGRAEFEWLDEGWARVACPLDLASGEMIVFRYEMDNAP